MLLRFFAEEGVRVCVWGDEEDADETQHRLPIPPDLAADMEAWIVEYNGRVQDADPQPWTPEWAEDHDRRGFGLSRRLQHELGHAHQVQYKFETATVRRELGMDGDGASTPDAGRLAELVRAVAVLALPGAEQLEWAAARGGPMSPDALVIDLYELADQVPNFHRAGWIRSVAADRILALTRAVEDLGTPERADVWTPTGLRESKDWLAVRALARSALSVL